MSGSGPRKWEFDMDSCPSGETEAEAWTCGPGCAADEEKGQSLGH